MSSDKEPPGGEAQLWIGCMALLVSVAAFLCALATALGEQGLP